MGSTSYKITELGFRVCEVDGQDRVERLCTYGTASASGRARVLTAQDSDTVWHG